MSLYPERPIYSPWSDIGSALTQGAGIVNQLDQSRNALQALVEKRALAAFEKQRQEMADKRIVREDAQKEADRMAKEADAQRALDAMQSFQKFSQGENKQAPPLPYAAPGLGPNGEAVTAGISMIRPSRQELQDKALALGVYGDSGVKAYMDDTKPATGLSLDDRLALENAKAGLIASRPISPYQEQMMGVMKDRLANSTANRQQQQSNQQFGQEQKLQDKFLTQTKDFRDVRDAYGRIQVSAKDPSPAGDLSLIFNYMKMLDPGSTVREGEFASAAASGSFGDRIQAAASKLVNGERLSPDQRSDFMSRSKVLYLQQAKQAKKTEGETRKQASAYGLDESRTTTDLGLADGSSPTPSAPAPLNMNDPKVKRALAAGYTPEQIKAHLGAK